MEYIRIVENENSNGMYDLESQMQESVKSTPSFKRMSMYINDISRHSSNFIRLKKNSFKKPSEDIQRVVHQFKSESAPIMKKFKSRSLSGGKFENSLGSNSPSFG